jgi:hypothetical protein
VELALELIRLGRARDALQVGTGIGGRAGGGELKVVTVDLPRREGQPRLTKEFHVSQDGQFVLGQERAGPIRAVVDLRGDAGLKNFVAAIGQDSIVGDFAPFPADLVAQIVALVAAIEAQERLVAVGGAKDLTVGDDGRKRQPGLFRRAVEVK